MVVDSSLLPVLGAACPTLSSLKLRLCKIEDVPGATVSKLACGSDQQQCVVPSTPKHTTSRDEALLPYLTTLDMAYGAHANTLSNVSQSLQLNRVPSLHRLVLGPFKGSLPVSALDNIPTTVKDVSLGLGLFSNDMGAVLSAYYSRLSQLDHVESIDLAFCGDPIVEVLPLPPSLKRLVLPGKLTRQQLQLIWQHACLTTLSVGSFDEGALQLMKERSGNATTQLDDNTPNSQDIAIVTNTTHPSRAEQQSSGQPACSDHHRQLRVSCLELSRPVPVRELVGVCTAMPTLSSPVTINGTIYLQAVEDPEEVERKLHETTCALRAVLKRCGGIEATYDVRILGTVMFRRNKVEPTIWDFIDTDASESGNAADVDVDDVNDHAYHAVNATGLASSLRQHGESVNVDTGIMAVLSDAQTTEGIQIVHDDSNHYVRGNGTRAAVAQLDRSELAEANLVAAIVSNARSVGGEIVLDQLLVGRYMLATLAKLSLCTKITLPFSITFAKCVHRPCFWRDLQVLLRHAWKPAAANTDATAGHQPSWSTGPVSQGVGSIGNAHMGVGKHAQLSDIVNSTIIHIMVYLPLNDDAALPTQGIVEFCTGWACLKGNPLQRRVQLTIITNGLLHDVPVPQAYRGICAVLQGLHDPGVKHIDIFGSSELKIILGP